MGEFLRQKKVFSFESYFSIYAFCSFVASMVIWLGFFWKDGSFFTKEVFSSTLLVSNFYYYFYSKDIENWLKERPEYQGYFLIQLMACVGMGFTLKAVSGMYLALVPVISGASFFFLVEEEQSKETAKRGAALLGIGAIFLASFFTIDNFEASFRTETTLLASFFIWSIGSLYFIGLSSIRLGRSRIYSFLKRNHQDKQDSFKQSQTFKYFIHDLLNQIHGIGLFIDSKTGMSGNLNAEEVEVLKREIKAVKTMVLEFSHCENSIKTKKEAVTFHALRLFTLNQINSYLPQEITNVDYKFEGNWSNSCSTIDLGVYSRILGNLLKNISEQVTHSVLLTFTLDQFGLTINTENEFGNFSEQLTSDQIVINLQKVITSKRDNRGNFPRGLGLDSINSLCEKAGGTFEFKIHDKKWVNQIFIPFANESIHKKAA